MNKFQRKNKKMLSSVVRAGIPLWARRRSGMVRRVVLTLGCRRGALLRPAPLEHKVNLRTRSTAVATARYLTTSGPRRGVAAGQIMRGASFAAGRKARARMCRSRRRRRRCLVSGLVLALARAVGVVSAVGCLRGSCARNRSLRLIARLGVSL